MDARAKAKASISPAAALASPAAQAVAARVAAAHAAAVAKAGSSSGVSGLTGQITIGSMAQASPAGGGGSHSKKAPPKKASPTKSAPSGGAKGASASRKAGGSGDKRPASTASSSSKSKKKKTSSGPSSSASSSGGGASGGAVGGSGGGAKAKPSTALHAADCKYHNEICSAMFVNGCTKEVDPGVLRQVDRVVRREMIEVTRAASEMAKARNSRNLTLDDVLFVCRRNRAKIQRIAAFMSAREDAKKRAKGTRSSQTAKLAAGRHKPAWKWELLTDLNDMVKDNRLSVTKGVEADVRAHSQALKRAAEAVNDKNYKEFASAQKESFAHNKLKKFRDWIAFQDHCDLKPNDDCVEVMGFLAKEAVAAMSARCCAVQREQDATNKSKAASKARHLPVKVRLEVLEEVIRRQQRPPRPMMRMSGWRRGPPQSSTERLSTLFCLC